MKSIIILTSLLLISPIVQADEASKTKNSEIWLKITIQTQNVAHKMQRDRRLLGDSPLDPDQYKKDIETTNIVLSELVKAGELEVKLIELLPLNKLGDEGLGFIMEYAESLSEKFGHFVALELLDMGLTKQLSIYQPSQPFPLHLRLPKKEMNDFIMKAQNKGLIHKQQAQQAGTGQPATRPESKPEGSDKPQPEAEGRSR
jgi:hypothetical protein